MKKLINCGFKQIEHVYFNWHLTNACNYACAYCPSLDVLTKDFNKEIDSSYRLVLARLKNIETKFDVCLTGGEPSLHPHIFEIILALDENPMAEDIVFFTNLSRTVDFYTKLESLEVKKTILFASYHPTYHSQKFIDKSIELAKILGDQFSVHINFSDDPTHWSLIKTTIDTLRNNNVKCKPCMLTQNRNYAPNYNEEFYKMFYPYLESTRDAEFFQLIDCAFDDGSIETLRNYDIELRGYNQLKGFRCTPMSYNINEQGIITNTCTNRLVPLFLSDKNLKQQETCPHNYCTLTEGMDYYKERT